MSLLDALHAGIGAAHSILNSGKLEAPVLVEHYLGGGQYTTPTPVQAVVDFKQQQVETKGGVLTSSKCQVTFLDVATLAAATAPDGKLFAVDILTLPDGTKGTAIAFGGFLDSGTSTGVITEVWL